MKLKHLLCIVFLTTTGIALAQAQTTKTTPPTEKPTTTHKNPAEQLPFAEARNMTVMVFWADPPASPGMRPRAKPEPNGSGVWIGKTGYIATCNHVIANWPGPFKIGIPRDPYVTEGSFSVSISGAVNTLVAVLVASDPATDVAILKAEKPPGEISFAPLVTGNPAGTVITPQNQVSPKGATLNTDFPQEGETLLLAGFPLPDKTDRTLILQTGVATGLLSIPQTGPPVSALRIMLSLVSNPGNSGGPVLDADGKLIGLLEGNLPSPIRDTTTGQPLTYKKQKIDENGRPALDPNHQPVLEDTPLMQNAGISLAVPARFIKDLADKNHIDLN